MYTVVIHKTETRTRIGRPPSEYERLTADGPAMGYVQPPDQEITEQINVKVLEQGVETLDLVAVIKAINGIE